MEEYVQYSHIPLGFGTAFLEEETNSQISSQQLLNSYETHLFELNKEVGSKAYNLYEIENHINGQEKDLKQNISYFKNNLELQLNDIRSKIQMTQKMGEMYDNKIFELNQLKKLNLIKIQNLKDKILELQEIEIKKNQYSIQLDQHKSEDFSQEKINSKIEKTKEKIDEFFIKINDIKKNIKSTKNKINKNNQRIDAIHKNRQSFSIMINKLSQEVANQSSNDLKTDQKNNGMEISKNNDAILQLRKKQLSYLNKISNLYSKNLLIESQLSNITKKINTYRNEPRFISMNSECDIKSNEAFIKLHQKCLKRTESINQNAQNLFTTLQNDIKKTKKDKKAKMKEISIVKNDIFQLNQNEINLTNYLNQIEQKIKKTEKSTEKISKLMDYYDECSNVNPICFTFSNKDLDKIRKPAFQLAKNNISQEAEMINQIKEYKNQSKQLIFEISKQRLKNNNLKKKVDEMYNKRNK